MISSLLQQVPVTGAVQYKKVVYRTCEARSVNVHFFGDRHYKKTRCVSEVATDIISLFESSLLNSHQEVDVFIEFGLGFDIRDKTETNYLNELIKLFQEKYQCLLAGSKNKVMCSSNFPNVRFHNIDFRSTLYYEYIQVIDYWFDTNVKNVKNIKKIEFDKLKHKLPTMLIEYAKHLHDHSTIPYPHTGENFMKDREMLRLSWVYDMVVARNDRLDGKHNKRMPFAQDLDGFLLDLYYLICSSPSVRANPSLNNSPIHEFFPHYLSADKVPYYLFRLEHEYCSIPEAIKHILVRRRFDTVLKDKLESIRMSSTPKKIRREMTIDGYKKHIEHLSWFMDIYVCFRLLKPYISKISNSVVLVGVNHIQQIEKLMDDLGMTSDASPTFQNTDEAQCIAVPVVDKLSLLFDDNVFSEIVPDRPTYIYTFRSKSKKRSMYKNKKSRRLVKGRSKKYRSRRKSKHK